MSEPAVTPAVGPPGPWRGPIPASEYSLSAIRAQGAGGQNVNKVSNAAHLRFDVRASSLPDDLKRRLIALRDRRVSEEGVIVIKAQSERSLAQNQAAAVARLNALVARVASPPRPRKPTRPTRASRERRLENKQRRGELKASRGRVSE